MAESEVILIGGAPFAGKTTLARRLAARQGYGLVSTDDLGTAVRAYTNPQSYPALHHMTGWDYRDYYTVHSPAALIQYCNTGHDALWPAIAAVIAAHLEWAGPVIVEGWALDPARVASLAHPRLRACWLHVDEAVLEARLRANTAFVEGCADVERFIRHYHARSCWANDRAGQAVEHEAAMVIQIGPDDEEDTLSTRCAQRLWPRG